MTCSFCTRVNLSDADVGQLSQLTGKWRFAHLHALLKTRKKCAHCGAPQCTYSRTATGIRTDWCNATFVNDEERAYCTNATFTARDAQSILSCISRDDARTMGFERTHPKDLILDVIVVPPPVARPAVAVSEGCRARGQNDMTLKLLDVLRRCVEVRTEMASDGVVLPETLDVPISGMTPETLECVSKLQIEVFSLMSSNVKPPRRVGSKAVSTLKSNGDRLRGKEGRIRASLCGKRVNHSARCVISPDVTIDIDEVGVPKSIALQLTVPERVNVGNLMALTRRVIVGPGRLDGAESVITNTGSVILLEFCESRKTIRLQVGWIVHRYLCNGDSVIFNRQVTLSSRSLATSLHSHPCTLYPRIAQPSLHKMGMLGHRVRITSHSTFRVNLAVTSCYNADFDGDEMNIHVCQSPQSIFECASIMSVPAQLISVAANKPSLGVVQDACIGMYLMTRDDVWVNRAQAMRLVGALRYPHREWWNALPKPERDGAPLMWSGRQIASLLFPPSLSYKRDELVVDRGTLQSGTLTKQTLSSSGSLLDILCRDYGVGIATHFLSDIQRLSNEVSAESYPLLPPGLPSVYACFQFLLSRGFGVGIADCVPSATSRDQVRECTSKAVANVNAIGEYNVDGLSQSQRTQIEGVISQILSKTLMNVATVVNDCMSPDNSIKCMVACASKGNPLNLAQICGIVGQQPVEGSRVCSDVARPLSHFSSRDGSVEKCGFVQRSYVDGLRPSEHFFHAMGGREGLVDTSCKTAVTGYLQRRLVKVRAGDHAGWAHVCGGPCGVGTRRGGTMRDGHMRGGTMRSGHMRGGHMRGGHMQTNRPQCARRAWKITGAKTTAPFDKRTNSSCNSNTARQATTHASSNVSTCQR